MHNIILVSIIINTLVLALKWYRQPQELDYATDVINYIFAIVFGFEAAIKMIGYGFAHYFRSGWNKFDFFIVVTSVLSIFISFTSTISIKGAVTIVRAFRILRIARLIRRAKSLHLIFNTFLITLPALVNVGGLLFLLVYFYSILGMQLFGTVKRNGVFTETLNFENFTNAFCAMCAVATGDGWNDIMDASIKRFSIRF